jgi:hypothetical protein
MFTPILGVHKANAAGRLYQAPMRALLGGPASRVMQDAELFDRCMRERGGRLSREIISPDRWAKNYGLITSWAEELIASARKLCPDLPHIHFDFVRNQTINALAFKAEGRYFIAFHTGTRYMLELIFFRMLSDTRLFDFIPSSAGEESNLPPFKYSVFAEEMYQAGIRPIPPKTKERRGYAERLLHHAFLFLIGHELAHIILGHIDLISNNGTGVLSELEWNLPNQKDLIERQAMEADADMRSVYSAIHSSKLMHEASMPEESEWIATRRSVTDLLFDRSFAMNTVFRIFGDLLVEESDLSILSYPPGPLRRFMATFFAHMVVSLLWRPPDTKNAIKNAFRRGALYTDLAFMIMMNQDHGAKGISQVFGGLGLDYVNKITDYSVHTLAEKLRPFAYEPPLIQDRPDESIEEVLGFLSSESLDSEELGK